MNPLVDLEPELDLFLVDKGISTPIFFQRFSEKSPDAAIMIESTTLAGELPIDVPIDAKRIKIVSRDPHPLTSLTLANTIGNLIHGAIPGKFHPTSTLFLIGAFVDERPQRTDNEDKDLPEHTLFAVFRVRPLT